MGHGSDESFSSLTGVAIFMKTGKILDIEAMSRACKACNLKENLKTEDPSANANWKESHVNFTVILITVDQLVTWEFLGAKRIWERSIEKNKLRYITFMVTARVIWVFAMFILG